MEKFLIHVTVWVSPKIYYSSLAIQREEEKAKASVRDAAKKGQKDVLPILAKEIVRSRKAVNKIYASKAQLNSVEMSMKNQLGELCDICKMNIIYLYAFLIFRIYPHAPLISQ